MATDNSKPAEPHAGNFLRSIIDADLAKGTYAARGWGGKPGPAATHEQAPADAANIRTRFPPEPNGYLHVGHAKSICLNFGLARDYGGVCHMRFDDTNPEKEEQEYVDSILDAVKWLGFTWDAFGQSHLYFASDYFDFMYTAAEALINGGHAYVDEQSADDMRASRGSLTEAGRDSPYRTRAPADSLARFRQMRAGDHPEGSMVLRAKIDMASPNINLRDPAIYRIRKVAHHRTGGTWCIYPMYAFAHPLEDALERVTHSICTLEFEDQRPFYDWVLARVADAGLLARPLPHQYEFARLNLTYVMTSKRRLKSLVDEGIVQGWDDPRMPTIVGLRRRGYTPAAIQLFCERIGVAKADSWIDYSTLEMALRDDLDSKTARAMAVLDPLKLKLTNWGALFGSASHEEDCSAPLHPQHPERGMRHFKLGGEVWIEREDFEEVAPKGFFRLFPGNKVRLKYGYVIECTGCEKDAAGNIVSVLATVIPDTRSGTPGSTSVKVKGVITWVGTGDALVAEVRLYERLFTDPQPDAGGRDFKASLNPHSLKIVTAYLEPSLAGSLADQRFQFERHGYFVADRKDHAADKPVFNRITSLKESFVK